MGRRLCPLVCPASPQEGVHGHMTVEGGGADDAGVAWAPLTLEDPLGGGWKLVHYLYTHTYIQWNR